MSKRNKFNQLFLALVFIIIIIILTSCSEYKSEEENIEIVVEKEVEEEKEPAEEIEEPEEVVAEKELEEKEQEEQAKEEEQIPSRTSEVEFYFLLKGESYFLGLLKENQVKTYNMSGFIVSIESIIITEDAAKFRINDFTTKALGEKDSDATEEFEIIVKDIYYRR